MAVRTTKKPGLRIARTGNGALRPKSSSQYIRFGEIKIPKKLGRKELEFVRKRRKPGEMFKVFDSGIMCLYDWNGKLIIAERKEK